MGCFRCLEYQPGGIFERCDWLSDLKLRASYGVQGNVDKDTSPLVVGEWDNTQVLPDNSESNIIVSSPPNQYLRWEKTTNWNGGLDVAVLGNRIAFTADVYRRVSDDLIGMRSLRERTVSIIRP